MGYKVNLVNALSYSGVVAADFKNPIVEVKTKKEAEAAVGTGYFEFVKEDEVQETEEE